MSLIRRDQYELVDDFEKSMNRMLERMRMMMDSPFTPFSESLLRYPDANALAIDMTSDENNVIIRTEVPGFTEDEINVEVLGNMLTISAEKKMERENKNAIWHIQEMKYGKSARSVMLPDEVIIDKADAKLENGILTVKLPKQKPSPIQKIMVKAKNLLLGSKKDQ